MGSRSAPSSGKLPYSSADEFQTHPSDRKLPGSRAQFNTLAKHFSLATQKPATTAQRIELNDPEFDAFANSQTEAALASTHPPTESQQLESSLNAWMQSTKLSVAVAGRKGVGKSNLINTLLEASAPEEYHHAIRTSDQASSMEITQPNSSNDSQNEGYDGRSAFSQSGNYLGPSVGSSKYSGTSYGFGTDSTNSTPGPSPPGSFKFKAALRNGNDSNADNPSLSSIHETDESMQVETLRMDLRYIGVDPQVKEYGKETSYTFEGNSIVPPVKPYQPSQRVYKGFSIDEFAESKTKAAEAVYTPSLTPYASIPATPNPNAEETQSEVELDTKDMKRSTYRRATVYLFNGVTNNDQGKPQVNVQPVASRTFVPDDDWSRTIDWSKETQHNNDYSQIMDRTPEPIQSNTDVRVFDGDPNTQANNLAAIRLDDEKSYLLPQGNPLDIPQLVAIRYGEIPELIVSFPQEGELRLALWELHEIAILGIKTFQSQQHKDLIETRYRLMLGLPFDAQVPLTGIESPHDLPLDRNVSLLLGQNFRFVGLGKSLAQDRVFVRDKLKEVSTNYPYHMCKFLVRIPSSILNGNKELIELSGPYIHGDFGTKMAVENTNLLLVAVDKVRGLSDDIVHLLQDSSLAQKLAHRPELHKAIFVELAEKYNLALPSHLEQDTAPSFALFKQALLDQWRNALLAATSDHPAALPPPAEQKQIGNDQSSMATDTPTQVSTKAVSTELFSAFTSVSMRSTINQATLEQLVSSTTVLSAKPTLFRSVHLQDDFPEELLPDQENGLRKVLTETAIPSLLSAIPNRALAKAAVSVSQLSSAVLMKNHNIIGSIPTANPNGINPSSTTRINPTIKLETLVSTFAARLQQWKNELTEGINSIETGLVQKSKQVTANLMSKLNLEKHAKLEDVVTYIKTIAVKPLVDSAHHLWATSISNVPRQAEEFLVATQNLLAECAVIIDIQFPAGASPNPQQLAIQLRLQEFVRQTNDTVIRHISRFQDLTNQDVTPLTRESTIRVLQQHVIANPVTSQLARIQDLPLLCPKAAASIHSRFSTILRDALVNLDALQTEVMRLFRAVTFAIKAQSRNSNTDVLKIDQTAMDSESPYTSQQASNNIAPDLVEDDETQKKIKEWNKYRSFASLTAQSEKSHSYSPLINEATVAHTTIPHPTLTRLTSENALNWPSKQQLQQKNITEYEFSEFQKHNNFAELPYRQVQTHNVVQKQPDFNAYTSYIDSGNFEQISGTPGVADYENDGSNINNGETLSPWATVPGTYSILPQEESGILFNFDLWQSVVNNQTTSYMYFETLLKNSKITMGKSHEELFGDGNAQFKILAHQVYGSESIHPIVRLLVCSEMLSHADYYARLLELSRGDTPPFSAGVAGSATMDIQEYIAIMSHGGCRGDNITLCAFANFFGVDLLIFAPPFRQPLLLKSRRPTSQSHLAVVADHLSTTQTATSIMADHENGSNSNKAFCVALLPDDEYAILSPIKKQSQKWKYRENIMSFQAFDGNEADDEVSEDHHRNTSGQPKSFQALQRKRTRQKQSIKRSRTVAEMKDMETDISDFGGYQLNVDTDDEDDDDYSSTSDSEFSQAEIVKAIRDQPSKKRKRTTGKRMPAPRSNPTPVRVRSKYKQSPKVNPPQSGSSTIPSLQTAWNMGNSDEVNTMDVVQDRQPSPPRITIQQSYQFGEVNDINKYEDDDDDDDDDNNNADDNEIRKRFKLSLASHPNASPRSTGQSMVDTISESFPSLVATGSASSRSPQGSGKLKYPVDPFLSMRVINVPSLVDICLKLIVDCVENATIPSLAGKMPEEYLHRILMMLGERKKLTDMTIARVLDPTITRFSIRGPCSQVSDVTMTNLAIECQMLREFELINCPSASTAGLISVVSQSPHLEHLTIKSCVRIGNAAIQEVARKCPKLVFIDISGCPQITDVAIQELSVACTQLVSIVVHQSSQITDAAFSTYIGKSIQVLDLSECERLTDKVLHSIAKYCGSRLRILKMSGSRLSDEGMNVLAKACTELRVLKIANAENFSDNVLKVLWANCPHLYTLSLSNSKHFTNEAFGPKIHPLGMQMQLDDPVPKPNQLVLPCELSKVNLQMCFGISDDALYHLSSQCKQLRQLIVSYCEEISDRGVMAVAQNCPNLKALDLTKCSLISNNAINAVASNCPNLKKFILKNCPLVGNSSILNIASACKLIRDLDLSSTAVTDDALIALSQSLTQLKQLKLSECKGITSAGIGSFETCSSLEVIKLSGCKDLNDFALTKLAIGCPNVTELDLTYCSSISIVCLTQVLAGLPRLTSLNLRGYSPVVDQHGTLLRIRHPNIEDLNLSWCKLVDDSLLTDLAEASPNIVNLDLGWCGNITTSSFHTLAQKCRSLRTLNLRGCTKVGPLNVHYLSAAPVLVYR